MATTDRSQKGNFVLYGVILILALAVAIETAILLQIKNAPPENTADIVQPEVPAEPEPAEQRWAEMPADILQDVSSLQAQINQFFNMARAQGTPLLQDIRSALESDFFPTADLTEGSDAYHIQVDLPGVAKENIEIVVRGAKVTLRGSRQSVAEERKQDGLYSRERRFGSFVRTFTLPGPVKESEVRASYENGVLKLMLPKAAEKEQAQKVIVQ